eukprot:ANDGO_03276.mRNA.1 Regulator of nonsense transcripts 1 homolog
MSLSLSAALASSLSLSDSASASAQQPSQSHTLLHAEASDLPEHACAYCGISNPSSVVRCATTKRWFCNSSHTLTSNIHPFDPYLQQKQQQQQQEQQQQQQQQQQQSSVPSQAVGDETSNALGDVTSIGSSSTQLGPSISSNNRVVIGTASHIIAHLVRSRYREVSLHPDSPLGDSTLECYNCGCKNVFLLGYVPSKSDALVVLLCREPCLHSSPLKDTDWDLASWNPLIVGRAFVSWLVPPPSEEEVRKAKSVTPTIMQRMEDHWKATQNSGSAANAANDALANVGENAAAAKEEQVQPAQFVYEDGAQYMSILAPLVKLEAAYDRRVKESQTREGLTVRWDLTAHVHPGINPDGSGVSGGHHHHHYHRAIGYFLYPKEDNELRLVPGDELKLRHQGDAAHDAWEAVGHIVRLTSTEEVALEIHSPHSPIPVDLSSNFSVDFVWKSTSFDRMMAALKTFASRQKKGTEKSRMYCSDAVYARVLGHPEDYSMSFTVDAAADSKNSGGMTMTNFGGVNLPKKLSVPNLPELNHSQVAAIRAVLQRPLSLIQGPPGTGKTVTSAALVYHLARSIQGHGSVLVTAPSNTAVDQLSERIQRTGLRVVRLCARSRESVQMPPVVEQLTLHRQVAAILRALLEAGEAGKKKDAGEPKSEAKKAYTEFRNFSAAEKAELMRLVRVAEGIDDDDDDEEDGDEGDEDFDPFSSTPNSTSKGKNSRSSSELSQASRRKVRVLVRRIERDLLKSAEVVCTTCVGAGDGRMAGLLFRTVLLDEATQATEPEALIPLVKGAQQVVLVGDHCQLGPVIVCKQAAEAGLSRSLFERLVILGYRPIRLQVQYRMHPCLSEFPSTYFYEGTLQNGVTATERSRVLTVSNGSSSSSGFPWPDIENPMFVHHVPQGVEELSASGTSYLNRTEAALVERLVTRLLESGVTPDRIGVITPYEGQRAYIVSLMQRVGPLRSQLYRDVEVASVDSFQGREKDYIILSCVRSNERQGIGFLSDARRLNVALTRARYGLVIVGNARVLSRQPIWNLLLIFFKEKRLLVEGPLSALKETSVQLQKPRELRPQDRLLMGLPIPLGQMQQHQASSQLFGTSLSKAPAADDQVFSQQSSVGSVNMGMSTASQQMSQESLVSVGTLSESAGSQYSQYDDVW